jgi:hypothetical protein
MPEAFKNIIDYAADLFSTAYICGVGKSFETLLDHFIRRGFGTLFVDVDKNSGCSERSNIFEI